MLLPVGIEGNRARFPKGTVLLLLLNAGLYAACALQACIQNGFSLEAIESLPERTLAVWALWPDHPTALAFVTSPWLHLDLLHLGGNLLFLWIFGAAAEEALGTVPMLGVYLAGGLGSALFQFQAADAGLTPPDAGYAGSSGAVIALILVFAIRRYRARVHVWLVGLEIAVPVWAALGLFAVWYGVAPALLGHEQGPSGYWGHLGGAATSLILALAMRLGSHSTMDYCIQDAIAQIERGQLKSGLKALQDAARKLPDDSRIPLALARAYLKVWDRPAAAASYSHVLQQQISGEKLEPAWAVWEEAVGAGILLPAPQVLALALLATRAGHSSHATHLYQWLVTNADEPTAAIARKRLQELPSRQG